MIEYHRCNDLNKLAGVEIVYSIFYGDVGEEPNWCFHLFREANEVAYAENLSGFGLGPPAMSVRIALCAFFVNEKLGTSDEETVDQIRENPYFQYFLGYSEYCDEEPFHPTMFVHFSKRFGKKAIFQIIEKVDQKARAASKSPIS